MPKIQAVCKQVFAIEFCKKTRVSQTQSAYAEIIDMGGCL